MQACSHIVCAWRKLHAWLLATKTLTADTHVLLLLLLLLQVHDQALERGNRALLANIALGLPVRVFRRNDDRGGATNSVLFYDGLYDVVRPAYRPPTCLMPLLLCCSLPRFTISTALPTPCRLLG
jgi:hypothetical protein